MGAIQVRVNQIGGVTIDTTHYRWLRRALDQRGERADGFEVSRFANIPANELNARLIKAGKVELRPPSVEIVERHDVPSRVTIGH